MGSESLFHFGASRPPDQFSLQPIIWEYFRDSELLLLLFVPIQGEFVPRRKQGVKYAIFKGLQKKGYFSFLKDLPNFDDNILGLWKQNAKETLKLLKLWVSILQHMNRAYIHQPKSINQSSCLSIYLSVPPQWGFSALLGVASWCPLKPLTYFLTNRRISSSN